MRVWEGRLIFVKCFSVSYMRCILMNFYNDLIYYLCYDYFFIVILGRDRKLGYLENIFDIRR